MINMQSLTADSVEAIIGAIYMDGGISHANNFISRFFCDGDQQLMEAGILQQLIYFSL